VGDSEGEAAGPDAAAQRSRRLSSLSSRLALLIAVVLVISGLVTALYSAFSARDASESAADQATGNAHASMATLVSQADTSLTQYREDTLESVKNRIKTLTELQVSTLANLEAAVDRGEISRSDAQAAALRAMDEFRYDRVNYFFTYTPDMVALQNPNPKFLGDMIDTQDRMGKYFFREFREVALGPGAGFVDYFGTRLGASEPVPKISYVQYFEPWEWVVGTGLYVDDIDIEERARLDATREALSASLARTSLLTSGLFFIVSDDGEVVVSPQGRDLSALTTTDWGQRLARRAVATGASGRGEPVTLTVDAGFNGEVEPWLLKASSFPARGWTLVSAVPRAEIDAPGNSQALRQALLSVGVLLLGLLIGLLASRRIVRPVEQMTKAAVAMEQDRFDPAMLDSAAGRRDEVGTLARAFQRMGAEIVERERRLREQVRKLTVVIDRQKVDEEAGAIAESDFFRDLAQRKEELRKRSDVEESDRPSSPA